MKTDVTIPIRPLRVDDRASWELPARGTKAFYATATTSAEHDPVRHRLLAEDGGHGPGAFVEGERIGIAHPLFHTSVCRLRSATRRTRSRPARRVATAWPER